MTATNNGPAVTTTPNVQALATPPAFALPANPVGVSASTGFLTDASGKTLPKSCKLGTSADVNYAAWPGSLIDPLSSTTGWTVSTTGVGGSIVPTTLGNGLAGLQFTVNPGVGTVYITNNSALSLNYAPDTLLGIWIEVSDPGRVPAISILLSNDSGFTNYRTVGVGSSGGAVYGNSSGAGTGRYYIPFRCDAGAATGSPATAGSYPYVRIRLGGSYKNQGGTIKIAGFGFAPTGRPKFAFTFDDGFIAQYLSAFRILSKYGIPATLAVTSSLVGQTGYCSVAQLQAMYAAGWDMVCHAVQHYGFNGSTTSGNFGKLTICQSQTPGAAGALTVNGSIGLTPFDAGRHVVVWGGDQGVAVTIQGTSAVDGSSITETLYCQVGFYAVTKNLFAGLTAAPSVDQASTTSLSIGTSLSKAEMQFQITGAQTFLLANGMPRGAYDWVYPSGEFNATSTALLQQLGFRTARVVAGQPTCPAAGDFRPFEIGANGGAMASGGSAAFIAYIDDIINRGLTGIDYLHNFNPTTTDSVTSLESDLQLVCDALAQRARDGKVDLITQPQIPVA